MTERAAPAANPILYHLVKRLRNAGVPVSVSQYLDALRALEFIEDPFTDLDAVRPLDSHGAPIRTVFTSHMDRTRVRDRGQLVWLLQTLWARTARERKLVAQVVTRDIGPAPVAVAVKLNTGYSGWLAGESALPAFDEPGPRTRPPETSSGDSSDTEGSKGSSDSEKKDKHVTDGAGSGDGAKSVGFDLLNADSPDGEPVGNEIPLDTLHDAALPPNRQFTMSQSPLISPLWLTSVWRRVFRPSKQVDRTRIDAAATVREAARTGAIATPVYSTRRSNAARLTLMIDTSEAMAPWHRFSRDLVNSLSAGSSRLADVACWYFATSPGAKLYHDPSMRGGTLTQTLLSGREPSPLLILGEAGAARLNAARHVARRALFVHSALGAGYGPVVWINPMPAIRWPQEFAGLSTQFGKTHLLSLDRESLLRAADLLRGAAA